MTKKTVLEITHIITDGEYCYWLDDNHNGHCPHLCGTMTSTGSWCNLDGGSESLSELVDPFFNKKRVLRSGRCKNRAAANGSEYLTCTRPDEKYNCGLYNGGECRKDTPCETKEGNNE